MIEHVLQKLYAIEHIPSLPVIKNKLQNILDESDISEQSNIDRLIKYLYYDPSLTLELLKIANSESFGFRNKISSIDNAIHLLDNELIKLVISQHPVLPGLKVFSADIEAMIIKLIKHSIEVHSILDNIFEDTLLMEKNDRDELLTASTLHDVGLIFLLIYFPEHYLEILEKMRAYIFTENKQKKYYLPDHSLVSSILCESWHLPAVIRNSIAFHHFPWYGAEQHRIKTELLYVADSLSSSFYELFSYENDIYSIEENIVMRRNLLNILEKFDIDLSKMMEICRKSQKQSLELFSFFGMN